MARNRPPGEPVFGIGSHCDSNRNGGKYDGTMGVVTALVGASLALVMSDLKRMLAYSTMSHLGFMMLTLGAVLDAIESGDAPRPEALERVLLGGEGQARFALRARVLRQLGWREARPGAHDVPVQGDPDGARGIGEEDVRAGADEIGDALGRVGRTHTPDLGERPHLPALLPDGHRHPRVRGGADHERGGVGPAVADHDA